MVRTLQGSSSAQPAVRRCVPIDDETHSIEMAQPATASWLQCTRPGVPTSDSQNRLTMKIVTLNSEAHLVTEVHVARCVDQVEQVIGTFVAVHQGHRLGLQAVQMSGASKQVASALLAFPAAAAAAAARGGASSAPSPSLP